MPLSFADQEYWDLRFKKDKCAFDWLLPAPAVCDIVATVLGENRYPSARILHIGCGTSELSYLFRDLVANASQVHNVDYSQAAVSAGATAEQEALLSNGTVTDDRMRWSRADLLSLSALKHLTSPELSQKDSGLVIVDKSTSDAVACGEDISVEIPYPLVTDNTVSAPSDIPSSLSAKIHPLHILAVHLAALAQPDASQWIAISYSEDRFPFLPPYPNSKDDGLLDDTIIKRGFPDPRRLWKLEKKWRIKAPTEQNGKVDSLPEVYHWIYVLARTDVQLSFSNSKLAL